LDLDAVQNLQTALGGTADNPTSVGTSDEISDLLLNLCLDMTLLNHARERYRKIMNERVNAVTTGTGPGSKEE